jgi:hypothetical protein
MENHVDVIKVLLQDHRVDPTDHNSRALYLALDKNFATAFCLLAEDYRVDYSKWRGDLERVQKTARQERTKALLVSAVREVLASLQEVS